MIGITMIMLDSSYFMILDGICDSEWCSLTYFNRIFASFISQIEVLNYFKYIFPHNAT
jgi:hypothetical protein